MPKNGFFWKKLKLKIENRLIFSPRGGRRYPVLPTLKKKIEIKRLITNDCVKLHIWFVSPSDDYPVVVFCHGKSESITKWQNVLLFLEEMGYGVLMLSYRGHYKSAGLPSEAGLYSDADAAVEFLKSKGVKEHEIIFWGRSLGSAVACEMAVRYNLGAVILESAILDMPSASLEMCRFYLQRKHLRLTEFVLTDLMKRLDFIQKFDNYRKLQKIKCPILLLHSKNDLKVPYKTAIKLSKTNPNIEFFLCEDGSHQSNGWCFNKIKNFLSSLTLKI
ncbi:MAG: alpha/beta fold hydrolase [Candidatus Gastranaerophilales bacterium]|nr:alpha/beta fold hydrolase [Candidatus Gastranaerophilales bacterium]